MSFKTEAVSPCTIQTQGPLRASLFSAAGRGLTPVQMHCPMREGKPSAKLENHVLCLFSFFQFSVKRVMSACQQFLAILSHRRKLLPLWSTQHMASHVITRAQIQQVCTHRKAGTEPTLGAGLHPASPHAPAGCPRRSLCTALQCPAKRILLFLSQALA